MDEKRNYHDRAMTHFVRDPQRAEWTNMLVFMIFDQRAATLWQGYPPYPVQTGPAPTSVISAATLPDLATAIAPHLAVIAPHTGGFSLDPELHDVPADGPGPLLRGHPRGGHPGHQRRGDGERQRAGS